MASVPLGEPVIASILAFFIWKEVPNSEVIVSGFIILSGLFFIMQSNNLNIENHE